MYDLVEFRNHLEYWENVFEGNNSKKNSATKKANSEKGINIEKITSVGTSPNSHQRNNHIKEFKFEEFICLDGLEIGGKTKPCGGWIGGDYFDFHWRLDSREEVFSVAVGDSSGHGPESAPLMLTTREFLKKRAPQPGPISDVISEMNSYIASSNQYTSNFMTLFYLTIDTKRREILWVRAGHDPALVYNPDSKSIEELKGRGVALGVVNEFDYDEYTRDELCDGQVIVIATDGFWEAKNENDEMFSKKRLCEIIRKNSDYPAKKILETAFNALKEFAGDNRLQDDATLVIIKIQRSR